VRLLLNRDDIDPNSADIFGRTPLWWAARHGHKASVRLLLKRRDINPNGKDKWSGTPLSRAAENDYREVVRLLTPVTLKYFDSHPHSPLAVEKWGRSNSTIAACTTTR
jgi:ankyrin repeat protein